MNSLSSENVNLNNCKIALIICADDGYINNGYAITTIKSFLFHNRWFTGDIIFFDDNEFFKISNKNKSLLKSYYNNVVFKELDLSKYKTIIDYFKNDNQNTKFIKAYPKFEIFDIKGYDKILCVDGDILFIDNIKDLFCKDITIGVTSSLLYNFYSNLFKKNFYDIQNNTNYFANNLFYKNDLLKDWDSGGFNSGVIYIGNVSKLPKINISKLIIQYITNFIKENNKEILFFDQCILSYIFDKSILGKLTTIINPIYNTIIYDNQMIDYLLLNNFGSKFLIEVYKHSKILHFLSKPNSIDDNNYFKKIWNFYYNIPKELLKCNIKLKISENFKHSKENF